MGEYTIVIPRKPIKKHSQKLDYTCFHLPRILQKFDTKRRIKNAIFATQDLKIMNGLA
ncbi:hypothetical protein [Virgibacillus kimchii]